MQGSTESRPTGLWRLRRSSNSIPFHAWREHTTGFCIVGEAAQAEVFGMCLDVPEVARVDILSPQKVKIAVDRGTDCGRGGLYWRSERMQNRSPDHPALQQEKVRKFVIRGRVFLSKQWGRWSCDGMPAPSPRETTLMNESQSVPVLAFPLQPASFWLCPWSGAKLLAGRSPSARFHKQVHFSSFSLKESARSR
jgi:hypothetical protein